jgi:hypothetical protein
MAIELKIGGAYQNGMGSVVNIAGVARGDEDRKFLDDNGYQYWSDGRFYPDGRAGPRDIIRVISEPDAPPAGPIAHMFEDVPAVPASRRFVGGEIYSCVHLTKERLRDGVNVVIGNEFGHKIYATTSEARLLIAALQAAIDAIEAATPEETCGCSRRW